MDLFERFVALKPGDPFEGLEAIRLQEKRPDFMAKGRQGNPLFLIGDECSSAYVPSILLEHVSVEFQTTCKVADGNDVFEGQFAVVACNPSDPELYELFVRCLSAAVLRLPAFTSTAEIQRWVCGLLELFRALSQPKPSEIIGLWGELYVIAKSENASDALRAWRFDPLEKFDFSWPSGRVEVKATVGEQRLHSFSLEQLKSPMNGVTLIASLLLQPMSGGVGVLDLAKMIEFQLDHQPELLDRLWTNVLLVVGSSFSQLSEKRFDLSYAERNLLIFDAIDIPRPQAPDHRITNVRFSVDLSGLLPHSANLSQVSFT